MADIIERNNHLANILANWNHEEVSHTGVLGLRRRMTSDNGDYYTYTKTVGRTDLKIIEFNLYCDIDGKKHAISDDSYYLDPFNTVAFNSLAASGRMLLASIVKDWFITCKEEIKIQVHYMYWFNSLSFSDITLAKLLEVFMSYRYDEKEATEMYNTFRTQSLK